MTGGWQYIYDAEFAYVYDEDTIQRYDLKWDGEHLSIEGEGELDIEGVIKLRKLLQAVERKAKK